MQKIIFGILALYAGISGYIYYTSSGSKPEVKEPAVAEAPLALFPDRPEEPMQKADIIPNLPAVFEKKEPEVAPVPTPKAEQKPTVAKRVAEKTKKVVNKTVDSVQEAIDNPSAVSLGKCSSSHSRYHDKNCGWARDVLAEQGITRYRDEFRATYGYEK